MSTFSKWNKESRYRIQTNLIRAALNSDGHELNTLLAGMDASEEEGAIYFCGGRLDNDFCFGSGDLAFAISKLPKDASKAGVPGYHPESTEVYVIFQGNLVMELLDEGHLAGQECSQFDVVVIPGGQCHRVSEGPGANAASFIVKTNPRHKPGVVRCKGCTHYSNPADCPVRTKWLEDRKLALERTLNQLRTQMEVEILELEENCPSKRYRDYSDGSSSYSEILHAEATSIHVASVRERFRARADDLVRAWLQDDGLPEMEQMAREIRKQVGL